MKRAWLCLMVGASMALGAAGDLLGTKSFPNQRWSDVAFAPDGTVWALGEADGLIHHLSAALELTGTIPHPFGAAAPMPPFRPVCRGLAHDGAQSNLIVLNGSTFEIARVNPADGAQIGAYVLLQPPAGAALAGLAFDASGNVLWSVDSENDRVLGFDPATGALLKSNPFPGDAPPEAYLHGTALAYVTRTEGQFLYVPWGDIFAGRADTVAILNAADGAAYPFEIPLAAAGAGAIRGIAVAGNSILVLLSRTNETAIASLSGVWPSFLPVSNLACRPQENGTVELTWRNNGAGPGGAYTELSILRNGAAVAQLGGGAAAYTDTAAPAGVITYTVRPRQGLERGLDRSRTLRNGRGAVLSWIPFPGGTVSGIAVDPDTGDVWAADSKAIDAKLYRLRHFTPDLVQVGYVDVSLLSGAPYGLTFWPNAPIVDPPETLLMLGNDATNAVQKLRRNGTAVGGAVPLQLPAGGPNDPPPKVGSLAFDPGNGDHFLSVLDDNLHRIVWVDRYGFPPNPGNTELRRLCTPAGLYQATPHRGLDRCPQSGHLHFGVAGAAIREVDSHCNVTTFDLQAYVPAGHRQADQIRDFAYRGNIVYVASPANNAIFRILAFPTGRPFVRGDADESGAVNVADVVSVLMYLFEKGPDITCKDAADVNDDGRIDISDTVYLLFYLFGEGPPPPAPFPEPGTDPTLADELSC
ncbi:MAG TPA: dockerin type I repeat-containing protein [Planctomycetota bacterium]|nr:dockerin type I repeat-containing protein [Planctomycetota bacterium]OQC22243.1 MAG: hypothetical protein BWX69_00094 [Planctomycetes bacterium ADurb.Bin069]NMD35091.1 hypothetical protein [Planctomycetota bacterium]HNS00602.1 dockerin type I repeat-containing protein [Planctomycetota bacterium]HNU25922.1 dockerin type I repeat-containing protein [Planctomycetota bacterium]